MLRKLAQSVSVIGATAMLLITAVCLVPLAHASDARADIYSATYDPASLADAAGATTTITVPSAILGDACVASFSLDLQGITLTCYISAAKTASVRFQNESGGTLDLASGTLRVFVLPRGTR